MTNGQQQTGGFRTGTNPLWHGRWRPGCLHRRRPPHRRPPRRPFQTGRRRAFLRGGARPRLCSRTRTCARPQLCFVRRDGQGRSAARRRHRSRGDRHAQPRALCRGENVPRCRHPRHLRQAADVQPRRREEACRRGRPFGKAVRADPQLYRLPDDPSGARDGVKRGARQDQAGAGRICPGLVDDTARGDRAKTGRVAHRSGALRRRRRQRRYRHPCL